MFTARGAREVAPCPADRRHGARHTGIRTLYVPVDCAHGFQAFTDTADVSYMIDRTHDPDEDVSIAFDDPGLAIPWPLPVTIMSPRDRLAPPLADTARLLM